MIATQTITPTRTPNVLPLHSKYRSPLPIPNKQPSNGPIPLIPPSEILSEPEIEVLKLFVQGICLKEMPKHLKVTASTIGKRRDELRRKLTEAFRIEMTDCMFIHYALAVGLVPNKFSAKS